MRGKFKVNLLAVIFIAIGILILVVTVVSWVGIDEIQPGRIKIGKPQ